MQVSEAADAGAAEPDAGGAGPTVPDGRGS